MIALLPCPYCGGAARFEQMPSAKDLGRCSCVRGCVHQNYSLTRQAIAAWNRRSIPDGMVLVQADRLEKLEGRDEDVRDELAGAWPEDHDAVMAGNPADYVVKLLRERDAEILEAERLRAVIKTLEGALREIARYGDGWEEHDPPRTYAGTTGEGHAKCREIARSALEGK